MVTRIGPKNKKLMRTYLRAWRDHFDLTQEQVADRIGTTKATVSRMEIDTREPNLGYLAAFAEALGIETQDVFRDPARPTQNELLSRGISSEQIEQAIVFIEMARKAGGRPQ